MFHYFVMFGTVFVAVQIIMLLFWGLYLVQRNVSVVDIGWGMGFIGAVMVDFILGDGYFGRKVLVFIVVASWALRLVVHLANRYLPEKDDPRYQLLLQSWPFANYPLFQVYTLFAFQGLLVAILSIPFGLMSQNGFPYFSVWEVFGLLLWMVGVVGESIADNQLRQFKNNPNNEKQVCECGLWGYSRHPNYFFEWVVWLGFCIMALSSPGGWLSILSPVIMLYLLLKVSGVPYAEASSLATKGDLYRDYQSRTSVFIPWFRRKVIPKQLESFSHDSPQEQPKE